MSTPNITVKLWSRLAHRSGQSPTSCILLSIADISTENKDFNPQAFWWDTLWPNHNRCSRKEKVKRRGESVVYYSWSSWNGKLLTLGQRELLPSVRNERKWPCLEKPGWWDTSKKDWLKILSIYRKHGPRDDSECLLPFCRRQLEAMTGKAWCDGISSVSGGKKKLPCRGHLVFQRSKFLLQWQVSLHFVW